MENISESTIQEEIKEELSTKEEIEKFVKDTLPSIKIISDWYKKFFESSNSDTIIITEIEQKMESIKKEYEDLFVITNETGETKITELDSKFSAIKNFHAQLLDGEGSISARIKEAQNKINEFFQYLFGIEGVDGEEKKIKQTIKEITDFHIELTQEGGIKQKVFDAHKEIVEKHEELFKEAEGSISKSRELADVIEKIESFNKKIDAEINPDAEKFRNELKRLEVDYQTKSKEIGSLLSDATARTLAEGYLESMHIYGNVGLKNLLRNKSKRNNTAEIIFQWFSNSVINVFNYILFITPLVLIAFVFIEPGFVKKMLVVDALGGTKLDGIHYIFYKISVSVPLLWVTWHGQRNIFQRKRLFEEYNHKLRVVQMYLLFSSKDNAYELAKKTELEDILLQVVGRNTSKIFGKDETMLDKIVEFVRALRGTNKESAKGVNSVIDKI